MRNVSIIAILLLSVLLSAGCMQQPIENVTPAATSVPTTPTPCHPQTTVTTLSGPGIDLKSGSEYHVGDIIRINGTTNLSPGTDLLIEVVSSSFYPTNKTETRGFSGASAIVTIEPGIGGGYNVWSYSLNTAGFVPDTYVVTVSGITVPVQENTTITLLPAREGS